MELKPCTLYVTATPIGNLSDLSPRAAEVLTGVDFIAAEDTRVTGKLLAHLGVKKPLVSYFEHNKREKGEIICARLLAGENCAIVTDAGTPAISDPGEELVKMCLEKGVAVSPIPGPSAVISALCVCGLATGRFCFEGFLSVNKKSRRERLEAVKDERRTMVFYEAPHKLVTTLADMLDAFGDRAVTLCRELTKLHEEIWPTTLSAALERYTSAETPPRGEYVLCIGGSTKQEPEPERPVSRNELYRMKLLKKAADGGDNDIGKGDQPQ